MKKLGFVLLALAAFALSGSFYLGGYTHGYVDALRNEELNQADWRQNFPHLPGSEGQ